MSEINKAAQALGALGGKARARSISKERAREIGRKAGLASAAKRKQAQDTKGQEKPRGEAHSVSMGQSTQCPNCGFDQDGSNPTHCLSCGWPLAGTGQSESKPN